MARSAGSNMAIPIASTSVEVATRHRAPISGRKPLSAGDVGALPVDYPRLLHALDPLVSICARERQVVERLPHLP
jgi:hypothetical protein